MANKKIQATATLFLDTKDAQNDAKKFVNDLKQKLSEVETAADKMTVFKDMVAYIAQVDKALAALRAKNGDAFNSMFDGLDTNLKKQFQELFGVDDGKLGQLDILREKLATLTPKSSMGEIRELAGAIKDLYNSVGKKPPALEFLDGSSQKAKIAYIHTLTDAIGDFATVWNDVNARVSQGFGGTGSSKSGVLGGFSKEVQEEIDKLKQQKQDLQETLNSLNGIPLKINIDGKDSIAELDKLINEYSRLQKIMNSTEYRDMSGIYKDKAERDKINAERIRVASLIQTMNDHMVDVGNEDEAAFATIHYQEINDAISYYNNFLDLTKDQTHEIRQLYENLISDINIQLSQTKIDGFNLEPTKDSIAEALNLLEEANQIMGQMSYEDPNFDLIEAQIDSLANKIKSLAKTEEQVGQIEDIWDKYSDSPNDMLDELCNILSVNIPKSAEKAKDAIDNIAGNNNQPSKQNISILAKQLQEIYNISRQIGDNEIGFAVDIDGAAYFVQSADHMVKVADEASVAVRALNENLTILGHTHPNGGGLFSAGDYRSAISQKRSGMNMPVVAVGSNAASLLNLDGVDENTLDQIERVLDRFKDSDDAVGPSVVKELQNILSNNGFVDALQVVDISNGMDELSEALLKLSMNATEVQTPLQKLQSLIQYYSGNKLGTNNVSQFADEWKEFESGAKSAAEVFDSVMYKLNATDLEGNYFNTSEKEYENLSTSLNMIKPSAEAAGNAIDQAKNKLEEFLSFADKMQHENLYGSAENNVDIGKYLERLETAKTELEALGAQGLITAEDLEKVNLAFTEATSHLESETSHYDSYYSGSSFDYYDDYKQEQSKNEDLENELTRKEERIAELESDLRASDDALQETLGNKYALIAESRTLEIERAELLLQKQNLEYEDILALMQSYQNLQDKAKEAFDYGDEKAMHDMQDLAGQIYDRVVPQNLDDFTEPDKWFKAVGMSAEEGAQKLLEFRERLEAVRSANDDLELSDSEDIGDLQRENGALQDKLDLLNEIATAYGNNITQRDRNTYDKLNTKEMEDGLTSHDEDRLSELGEKIDEADAALEEFGNTYDKIILKLANGKKVEILPDDAGLRALNRFSDEGYGETYNGIDIDDVIFVRKQEQAIIEESNDHLREQLNLQEQINHSKQKESKPDTIFYDSTDGQLAFFDNVLQGAQRAENKVEQLKEAVEGVYTLDNQNVTDDTRDELIGLRDALDTVKTPKDLNDIIAKFEKLQTEIGILKASFERTGLNDIQNAERSLLGSFNTLSIDQKRELEPERDAVIKQLETYKNAVLNGQKVELQAIEDTVRALREKIEVYKQVNKEANNAGSAQKKNSKFGDTVSRNATAKYNSLMGSANSDQFANSKEVAAIVGEYEKAYKAMIAFRNELRNSDGVVSEADEAEFKRLTTECNEYAKALDKLIKSTMKLKGNKANPNDYMLGSDFADDAQGRKQALTDFVKSVYDIDVAAENFKKDWNEVVFAVDNGDGTFTQMTAKLTDARNEIVALAGDTKKVQGKFESFINGVKNRLQSLSQYFIATVGIYDVWNVIKQGINHVREIDTALTELKKVTNETDASYNKFLQDMSKTGAVIGATVKDLTTMAADWSRLGYSMEEAGKLAESTAVLLNVSEFQDATAASEALISTMQAFQYTADESQHVVDILNEVGFKMPNNIVICYKKVAISVNNWRQPRPSKDLTNFNFMI